MASPMFRKLCSRGLELMVDIGNLLNLVHRAIIPNQSHTQMLILISNNVVASSERSSVASVHPI
jgi:hypothetical protein